MTNTEVRYAQIEKEALAFTWACERFSDYLLGLTFHIQTDHKPLVPLFSTKKLAELSIRIQRFRLRMMRFDFSISHVPGKQLVIADTLSRAPVGDPVGADQDLINETEVYANAIIGSLPISEPRLESLRRLQEADAECQQITAYCKSGWPRRKELPHELRPYHQVASELAVTEGLLMRQSRIIIPSAQRSEVLEQIHRGHQGIHKCWECAAQTVWWPGMSRDIEETVNKCLECKKMQTHAQRPQPLIPSSLPDLPWQKVGADLFEWKGNIYLLIVDYYSRFIEIAKLSRATTEQVICHFKSIFARHGIPEVLMSDNGPQFSSKQFTEFAENYQFKHITSSPYFPQSNGEAERAVGTIKRLLNKEKDPYLALLAYRSTPLQNGFSPSELLMSRKLRTNVPISRSQRQPKLVDASALENKDQTLKAKQKRHFDRHHGVRELSALDYGDVVWIPKSETEAIVGRQVAPRSYEIVTSNGAATRRNRQDMILTPSSADANTSSRNSQDQKQTGEPLPTNQATLRRSTRMSCPPTRFTPSWK